MINQYQFDNLIPLKQACLSWIMSFGLQRLESEDIFQQAMLKALSSTSLPYQEDSLKAWFYKIIKNTLIDEIRKKKLQSKKLEEIISELSLERPRIAELTENFCQCLEKLLQNLTSQEQEILKKHFYEGTSFHELANDWNISEGNIRVKALRARNKLKEFFRKCCGINQFQELSMCTCD